MMKLLGIFYFMSTVDRGWKCWECRWGGLLELLPWSDIKKTGETLSVNETQKKTIKLFHFTANNASFLIH